MTFDNGETNRLTGFQGVDREKLRELSDDSVLELHKSGGLDALHAHLLSLQNFRLIADRIPPEAETSTARMIPNGFSCVVITEIRRGFWHPLPHWHPCKPLQFSQFSSAMLMISR